LGGWGDVSSEVEPGRLGGAPESAATLSVMVKAGSRALPNPRRPPGDDDGAAALRGPRLGPGDRPIRQQARAAEAEGFGNDQLRRHGGLPKAFCCASDWGAGRAHCGGGERRSSRGSMPQGRGGAFGSSSYISLTDRSVLGSHLRRESGRARSGLCVRGAPRSCRGGEATWEQPHGLDTGLHTDQGARAPPSARRSTLSLGADWRRSTGSRHGQRDLPTARRNPP
jgi:hypothetical protein